MAAKGKSGTSHPQGQKIRYSAEQREKARRSYQEIGQSVARAVLVGRQSEDWAWMMVGDLGLYERWELDLWLELYRCEHRSTESQTEKRKKRLEQLDKEIEQARPTKLLKALRPKKTSNG